MGSRRSTGEVVTGALSLVVASVLLACEAPSEPGDAGADAGIDVADAGPSSAFELYRPRYHFTPATGWMNDPNGLVFDRGTYHLFFQHYPDGPFFGPMHWGHAESSDLVHWERRPIAIAPDPELGFAYSGSAVVVEGGDAASLCADATHCLAALFTHHGGSDGREKQSLAISDDDGASFAGYSGNPVLANRGSEDFRDPRVLFHAPTGRWVALLAAGDQLELFTSADLLDWTFASAFTPLDGSDGVLECPDLFELPVEGRPSETRWVLEYERNEVLASGAGPGPTAYYVVGDFDGTGFTAETTPALVDHGPDFYAAQSWSDAPDDRRAWLGWMSHWSYALAIPTGAWRGAMSVPRDVSLTDDGGALVLRQTPVPELLGLVGSELAIVEDLTLRNERQVVEGARGVAVRVRLVLEPGTATDIGVALRVGAEEETLVGFTADELYVDRTASGRSSFSDGFAARHTAPLPAPERVELEILVDASSVEVFANRGRVVFTERIFPAEQSDGVALYALGGEARVVRLTVESLSSIWP